ncbi:MAG TPA: glycosyltransferase family A protein [Rhodopila sp.]|jgi:glycosyltransferase involved in cell wall biosynthesis|nr:glycosyltransferase family A protein [Rhodopila sp.]
MHIAIIIPAFDIAPFLADAVRSVLAQTHSDWSLVIVDDGSTDATATIAAGFQDNRITLVRQQNAGVSAARNRGIQQAEATAPDAFLFLDGDDWLAPTALALLADALDAAPWAAAACARYARASADGATRLSPKPPEGCVLERLLIRNLFANGGHLLIRQEALHEAGAFRRDLSHGEDWEYWTRIALLGEFVAVQSRTPVLFVRERPGSAMLTKGTDPAAYRAATDAIHRNPAIAERLGGSRLPQLRRRADAETAWAVGRELIRHGQQRAGRRWLGRSIAGAPSPRRLLLMGLSWLRVGPFRPYWTAT